MWNLRGRYLSLLLETAKLFDHGRVALIRFGSPHTLVHISASVTGLGSSDSIIDESSINRSIPSTSSIGVPALTTEWPTISVNIAVYNEEANIPRCLDSVFAQDYPVDRLEVLLVDGGSVDRTLEIVSRYRVKLLHNPKRTCPAGRALGFLHATGHLHMYLDADMDLCGTNWMKRMVKPLMECEDIVASFPRYAVDRRDAPLARYLSHHQVPNPMLDFLSRPIAKTIVQRRSGYYICDFGKGSGIPFTTINMFRTHVLRSVLAHKGQDWEWIDPEIPLLAVEKGHSRFAYVPVGLHHHMYPNMRVFTRKVTRDVRESFIPTLDRRKTLYVDLRNPRSLIKFLIWVIYANALVPETIRATATALCRWDWVFLYRPIVSLLFTDIPMFLIVTTPEGRKAIWRLLMKRGGLSSSHTYS